MVKYIIFLKLGIEYLKKPPLSNTPAGEEKGLSTFSGIGKGPLRSSIFYKNGPGVLKNFALNLLLNNK